MKLGIIVATEAEIGPFYDTFGKAKYNHSRSYDIREWHVGVNRRIYVAISGIGEIAAASTTQYLIDVIRVEKIINYGMANRLKEEYLVNTIGVIESAVHYDFNISHKTEFEIGEYPEKGKYHMPNSPVFDTEIADLPRMICASGDKTVGNDVSKRLLRKRFNADVCDMEAAAIILTCNRNDVPCTLFKVISDDIGNNIENINKDNYEALRNCVELIQELI